MRAAKRIFDPEQLELLAPRTHCGPALVELNGDAAAQLDPIAGTEAIAYDFLARGGKHSRPFIVLAVYDAMTGGHGARPGAHRHLAQLPKAIMRAALSIETFHKASLVHDDIEDDDPFRYGEPTLHRRFGVPVAINVGDYLIGLGYRLVSREAKSLGAEVVADILDRLAEAHLKLAEGQGAELLWRDSRDKRLSSQDALRIYALKTAPAFEAALLTGLRMAGPTHTYLEPIGQFARSLGTAFQIINDLADWQPDRHNKLVAAGDVIGGRPTLLWALARESLSGKDLKRLEALAAAVPATDETVRQIGRLYRQAGVFDKAGDFIRQCEMSAREVAEKLDPPELRRLLGYLIEMVLKRPAVSTVLLDVCAAPNTSPKR
jgi:geranylgeranyl diphosphate synthase, type II